MSASLVCSICGSADFRFANVLWPELVAEWQLSRHEQAYVDRQQGCSCIRCGASLRIVALGNAVRSFARTQRCLRDVVTAGELDAWAILDCNGAEGISHVLAGLPGYHRADYPEHDMMNLSFDDGAFDLVIHSDTLEHIENPVRALEECRRVLKPSGRLCFTIPIINGRLSRNRSGLAASYHGAAGDGLNDFRVHTEFGADAWTIVQEAGFTSLTLTAVDYPSAIAITAWNELPMIIYRETEQPVPTPTPHVPLAPYDQDGLTSVHNHEFMQDPVFQAAYARGVQAVGIDYNWHWRVHTGLWAASVAAKLPGDFAEFGVNRGFLSSAIMQMLDWNTTGRRFYLLDTFAGIDERYINEDDIEIGVVERNAHDIETGFYTFDLDAVRANFAEWPAARIIAGAVPDTLDQIDSEQFAFAHIDMNCAPPEVAAADFLWPRLVPGGVILLDDYAYLGYRSQKLAMDKFAAGKGVSVLSLPTGQGLILKPPA